MTQATTKPQVTIYTASYCSYCVKAKDLLAKKGIDFTVVDVTDPATRTDMIAKSGGRRTVPQIFIEDEQGEQHIGGYDDLKRIMNDPHRVNNNPFDKLFQPYPYDRNDLKQIMNNSSTRKD